MKEIMLYRKTMVEGIIYVDPIRKRVMTLRDMESIDVDQHFELGGKTCSIGHELFFYKENAYIRLSPVLVGLITHGGLVKVGSCYDIQMTKNAYMVTCFGKHVANGNVTDSGSIDTILFNTGLIKKRLYSVVLTEIQKLLYNMRNRTL